MRGKTISCAVRLALAAIGGFFCLLPAARGAGPAGVAGERLALLVGVGTYEGGRFNRLPGADNDITALGDVLKGKGYRPGSLVIMTNGQNKPDRHPTAVNIRRQLDLLLDGREESDLVVIALAGHGIHPRGKGWFFCPADADLNDESTLISIDDLYKTLSHSKAGLKLLLVDACRNDPLGAVGRDVAMQEKLPESFTLPRLPDPPGGIAAFFSCSEGQVARERKDNDTYHGVFFKAVIEALAGQAADRDGLVTVPDLEKYVKREVQEYVRNEFSAKQFPEMLNKTVGLLPLTTDGSRLAPELKPITNSLGMKFVPIAPGTFTMGSPQDEEGRDANEVPHRVTLPQSFFMAATHVTRGQFAAFVAETDYKTDAEKANDRYNWLHPGFAQEDNHPVVCVSWNDAVAMLDWLCRKEKKTYRLPTEAEWEYACRADTTTPFNTGATIGVDQANYDGDYAYGAGVKGVNREMTTPVGSLPPNAWGLYDMHGNAWQWCYDVYGDYPSGPVTDPAGPAQDANAPRILRGGSWLGVPVSCRSACRSRYAPTRRQNNVGFRLVLETK